MDRFRAAILSLDNIMDKEKEKAAGQTKGKKNAIASGTGAEEDIADPSTMADGDGPSTALGTSPSLSGDTVVDEEYELPAVIQQRLRKLGKLETTYPQLLKSYKIAHAKATAVDAFEKTLKEHTPLSSIKDTDELVQYLTNLEQKSLLTTDELRRVAGQLDVATKELQEARLGQGSKDKELDDDVAAKDKELEELRAAYKAKENEVHSLKAANNKEMEDFKSKKEEELVALRAEAHKDSETLRSIITNLEKEVENAAQLQSKLEEVETSRVKERNMTNSMLETAQARAKELEDAHVKQKSESEDRLLSLQKEIDSLHLAIVSEEPPTPSEATTPNGPSRTPTPTPPAALNSTNTNTPNSGGGKNKKKRGKKGGAGARPQQPLAPAVAAASSSKLAPTPSSGATTPVLTAATIVARLQAEVAKFKEDLSSKEATITRLQEDMSGKESSVSTLETEVSTLKAKISTLEGEVSSREAQIERLSTKRKMEEDLREEIKNLEESLLNIGQEHVEVKQVMGDIKKAKEELESENQGLRTELKKAQETPKIQQRAADVKYAELKSKYQDVSTRYEAVGKEYETLRTKQKTLEDGLQKADKRLKDETAALKSTKDEVLAKASENRSLQAAQKGLKMDVARVERLVSQKDNEIQVVESKLAAEKTTRLKLEDSHRVVGRDFRKLESDKASVSSELEALRGVFGSVKTELAELSTQLKEAESRASSSEEELTEAQRLLGERLREAELMRQLLAEADKQADEKIRNLRERLDREREEHEQMQLELGTLSRKKTRENEELRNKVRIHEVDEEKAAKLQSRLDLVEKDLSEREADWDTEKQEREGLVSELQLNLSRITAQADEASQARESLQAALDQARRTGASQQSSLAGEKAKLKEMENRMAQSPDMVYLRTILLQFIEQRDPRLKTQLVPVLARLLDLNSEDQTKWAKAVSR